MNIKKGAPANGGGSFSFIARWLGACRSSRGAALAASLLWLGMLMVMGTGLVSFTTSSTIRVNTEQNRALALSAADAGLEQESNTLWRDFKTTQRFDALDQELLGMVSGEGRLIVSGVTSSYSSARFIAAVVDYVNVSRQVRRITIRSWGWLDRNNNGLVDTGEPCRTIDSQIQLALIRSKVFDYAYFVNNYGWMYGFGADQLIVNGDMRANGDFDFTGGRPTVNGSVYGCRNSKLIPAATGIVNITPTQWTNAYYNAHAPQSARMSYAQSRMGTKGSDEYENWRDLIYDMEGSMVRGEPSGAVVADSNGTRTYSGTVLRTKPTTEVLMPDLSDIEYYKQQSRDYLDSKQKYLDNSNNPYYNEPAYIEVYNTSTKRYDRVTTNGIYEGSVALIGTTSNPIRVHGPVTVTGDIVIKGVVQGQGTLYTGRNVHVVGNITYKQVPNFSGNDSVLIDKANEKKDMLALAARGSVIMGNTKTMSATALQYMTPPFTKARYDDDGYLVPAFNARERDSSGKMRYQTATFTENYINSISEPVNEINAVLYTNNVAGGDVAQGSKGLTFNGSLISRDEALVMQSLPLKMNYDNRLKWRFEMDDSLIDIKLPVSPDITSLTWDEI